MKNRRDFLRFLGLSGSAVVAGGKLSSTPNHEKRILTIEERLRELQKVKSKQPMITKEILEKIKQDMDEMREQRRQRVERLRRICSEKREINYETLKELDWGLPGKATLKDQKARKNYES